MVFAFPFLRRRHARRPIPILAYHALNCQAKDYASNDHIALEEDLRLIRRLGFKVARLADIARRTWSQAPSPLDSGSWVGLSFDDGTDHDYFDIVGHEYLGDVKSFFTILKQSAETAGPEWPKPTGTSFVIASPQARVALDRACMAGLGHWRDVWWKDAVESGFLEIGNHSWDHTHPALDTVAQRNQQKGTFNGIDNPADADAQIIQADQYIKRLTNGRAAPLFAYPYGEAPDYLVHEYFPRQMERHKMLAAFSTAGDYAIPDSNRWMIPRFVCGPHWKNPEGLERILRGA
jgi:polysaccharide deacetylase